MTRAAKISMTAVVTAFLVVAGVTVASNFVDNNTALPGQKTDRFPPTDPSRQWTASDANTVFNALSDIRTVLERDPQVVFNVKAFGATGAGAVSDSAAIDAAIAAAAVTTNGVFGGTVYFPKGTYLVSSQIVIPNGVQLRGDNPANVILRATGSFNGTSLIRNDNQTGGQEFAFLDSLQVDCNAPGGALVSEACVSWGSLFINSYIRNVIIMRSSSVGLHVFAKGSPGGTGPVLIENTWVAHSGSHNVLVEDDATNSGAFAGILFVNLTSEHQASNSSAVYLKGSTHSGATNFYNTHIEMGDDAPPAPAKTHRTGITIDGFPDVNFNGVQLQTGVAANIDAGISITNVARNLRIQIRSLTNINVINPVLVDAKNSVTLGAVHVPHYWTPDITYAGIGVTPVNGKSLNVSDSSGTSRAWFDTNGRLTGASIGGAGLDVIGDATNNRVIAMIANAGSGITATYGWYFPGGGAGNVLRERSFTSGSDVRQIGTDGSEFHYAAQTFQGAVSALSSVAVQGNFTSTGTIPTLSSCGTSPSIATGSTNMAGTFTTGSGATTCTVTFSSAFTNAPTCLVDPPGGGTIPTIGTVTTTTLPLTVDVASTTYRYICVGH